MLLATALIRFNEPRWGSKVYFFKQILICRCCLCRDKPESSAYGSSVRWLTHSAPASPPPAIRWGSYRPGSEKALVSLHTVKENKGFWRLSSLISTPQHPLCGLNLFLQQRAVNWESKAVFPPGLGCGRKGRPHPPNRGRRRGRCAPEAGVPCAKRGSFPPPLGPSAAWVPTSLRQTRATQGGKQLC